MVEAPFNQERALVGAFYVIVKLQSSRRFISSPSALSPLCLAAQSSRSQVDNLQAAGLLVPAHCRGKWFLVLQSCTQQIYKSFLLCMPLQNHNKDTAIMPPLVFHIKTFGRKLEVHSIMILRRLHLCLIITRFCQIKCHIIVVWHFPAHLHL